MKRNEELFKEDCEEDFKTVEGSEKYSFDSVLSDYLNICSIESSVADGTTSPDWTLLTARLVSIIRSERNRLQRIADWNERKKLKNANG